MVIAALATAGYLFGPMLQQDRQRPPTASYAAAGTQDKPSSESAPIDPLNDDIDVDETPSGAGFDDIEGAVIEFSYCAQCSFKSKAQEQIQQIAAVFPTVTINAHNHSPGALRELLASVCYWLSWALLGLLLGKARAVEALGLQVPETIKPYLENSLYTGGVYFLISMASTQLLSTGAYEVFLNGKLLHSKIDSGGFPTTAMLISLLTSAGLSANSAAASQFASAFDSGTPDSEFGIGGADEFE